MPPNKKKKIECPSSPDSSTSDFSSCSSSASNNYIHCLSTYLQEMAGRMSWSDTMDEVFITGYIAFKEDKRWENYKSLEWNYANLANHFVENGIMMVTGGQLQSRFYQIKRKWDMFCHLRGLSAKTETGIGWDAEGNHFTASDEHWASLEATNEDYGEFKKPNSCYNYERLTPILLGKSATGSRAQSANQTVPPERSRRPRSTSGKSRKGKANASTSMPSTPGDSFPVANAEDDVYYVPPIPGAVGGKRPASSRGAFAEPEGSRGSKSTRSSGSALEDTLSKIAVYSEVALDERRGRMEFDSIYNVMSSQDIIKEMEIPEEWKVYANVHYAQNEAERIVFIRCNSDTERLGYIKKIMRDKGLD